MKHYDFPTAAVFLAGTKASKEFFQPIFAERDHELTLVAFCDDRLKLIELICFPGTHDSCEISLREVANYAIGCAGFLIAHNHPSGIAEPSGADMKLVQRLLVLSEALDVQFLDNLIFAGSEMCSFRQRGLM